MKDSSTKKHIIVESPKHKQVHRSRIEQHYTKIVSIFVGISVILIACVVYFSFTKTVITVTPKKTTHTGSFEVSLSDIEGKVFLTEATGEASQSNLSGTTQKPGKASGSVTIVNNYSQNQPLIATTRLLSTEGVLFRTTETVTVPAGGSVSVDVIADQEGASGNIPASRFEIVALWDGLKDKIYATSSNAMSGGIVTQNVITAKDIETVTAEAKADLTTKAQSTFDTELAERDDVSETAVFAPIAILNMNTTSTAAVGDTVDALRITASGTAALAAYDQALFLSTISTRMQESLPEGFTLSETLDSTDVNVSLKIDEAKPSEASLLVTVPYTTIISTDHPKLDTRALTTLSEAKIHSHFAAMPEVESVQIEFAPFWLKRTPSLEDHIVVKVAE